MREVLRRAVRTSPRLLQPRHRARRVGRLPAAQIVETTALEPELALEGDRWSDLVRLGLIPTVLGIPAFRALMPIPQNDINTAGLTQNPGY